jgi:hypothetical protein
MILFITLNLHIIAKLAFSDSQRNTFHTKYKYVETFIYISLGAHDYLSLGRDFIFNFRQVIQQKSVAFNWSFILITNDVTFNVSSVLPIPEGSHCSLDGNIGYGDIKGTVVFSSVNHRYSSNIIHMT